MGCPPSIFHSVFSIPAFLPSSLSVFPSLDFQSSAFQLSFSLDVEPSSLINHPLHLRLLHRLPHRQHRHLLQVAQTP